MVPKVEASGARARALPKANIDVIQNSRKRGLINFLPGTTYIHEGRVVQLLGLKGQECEVRDVVHQTVTSTRLGALSLPNQGPFRGYKCPESIPMAKWKRARKIMELLCIWEQLKSEERSNKRLDMLAQTIGLGQRQLRRIFENYDGTVLSLLSANRGPKHDSKRLKPDQEEAVEAQIHIYRRKQEAWILENLMVDLKKDCENRKVKCPCERTVIARLVRHGYGLDKHRRFGHAKAKERENPHLGTYDPGMPLAQIQIDHTRIDVMIYDGKERVGLKRPWLTLVIDSATRVVLGFYLSFDSPSGTSVACALLNSVQPKQQFLKDHGLSHLNWDVWGKPRSILTDWAKEFTAYQFRRVCGNHGIKPTLRKFGKKHWGGRIERLIGTFMGKMHILPGTTFSNPKARDGYDSEARAQMDLAEVRMWVIAQIIEYNNTFHSELDRTPYQEWVHRLTTPEGEFVPPPLMSNYREFEFDFLPTKKCQVHGDYINWDGRPYQDGVLRFFKEGTVAEIKYHPERLRVVHVKDKYNAIHDIKTTQPPQRLLSLSEERCIASAKRRDSRLDLDATRQRELAQQAKANIQQSAERNTKAAKKAVKQEAKGSEVLAKATGEFAIPSVVME